MNKSTSARLSWCNTRLIGFSTEYGLVTVMRYLFSKFLPQHLGDVVIPMINTIFTWAFITRHSVQEMEINECKSQSSDMLLWAFTSCTPRHSASGLAFTWGMQELTNGQQDYALWARRKLFCNHTVRTHSLWKKCICCLTTGLPNPYLNHGWISQWKYHFLSHNMVVHTLLALWHAHERGYSSWSPVIWWTDAPQAF